MSVVERFINVLKLEDSSIEMENIIVNTTQGKKHTEIAKETVDISNKDIGIIMGIGFLVYAICICFFYVCKINGVSFDMNRILSAMIGLDGKYRMNYLAAGTALLSVLLWYFGNVLKNSSKFLGSTCCFIGLLATTVNDFMFLGVMAYLRCYMIQRCSISDYFTVSFMAIGIVALNADWLCLITKQVNPKVRKLILRTSKVNSNVLLFLEACILFVGLRQLSHVLVELLLKYSMFYKL